MYEILINIGLIEKYDIVFVCNVTGNSVECVITFHNTFPVTKYFLNKLENELSISISKRFQNPETMVICYKNNKEYSVVDNVNVMDVMNNMNSTEISLIHYYECIKEIDYL